MDQYRDGECEQVWTELVTFGPSIDERQIQQASAVAHETMLRVRHNIELIAVRLESIGYRFGEYDETEAVPGYVGPLIPPLRDWDTNMHRLQESLGGFPVSLLAWYQVVGGVDFTGYHPEWHCDYPDSLVVFPLYPEAAIEEYGDWSDWKRSTGEKLAYQFPIAPDDLHKANVSGGPPYAIELPNLAADAPFANEWHSTSFVNYLRICFQWGVFPGFERCSSDLRPEEHIRYLTEGLLAI